MIIKNHQINSIKINSMKYMCGGIIILDSLDLILKNLIYNQLTNNLTETFFIFLKHVLLILLLKKLVVECRIQYC